MYNKKSKALIGSMALILLVCFAFVALIKPAFSAGEKLTVKFDIMPSLAHQTLYITVTNNQYTSDNLDMQTIINEANFDTSKVKNIVFSELKNIEYTINDYRTTYNEKDLGVYPNGTRKIEKTCVNEVAGSHTETKQEYQPISQLWNSKTTIEAKNKYSILQIQAKQTKRFKLEFDTPIVKTANGWGSAGTVYLDLNGKTYVDKIHSSDWNKTYAFTRNIDCSSMQANQPFVINGSNGFTLNGNKQVVWAYCSGTAFLYYNNYADYAVGNDTDELPFEVEYGNETSYNPESVWDNSYLFVFHMNDYTSTSIKDSTSNGVIGNKRGTGKVLENDTGMFGKSQTFYGGVGQTGTSSIQVSWSSVLYDMVSGSNSTIEVWSKKTEAGGVYRYMTSHYGPPGWVMAYEGNPVGITSVARFYTIDNAGVEATPADAVDHASSTRFDYYVGRNDLTKSMSLFVNGTNITTVGKAAGSYAHTGNLSIGADPLGTSWNFIGSIDEIRISNVSRSNAWISATYQNAMGTTPGYGNLGTEVSVDAEAPTYSNIITSGTNKTNTIVQFNATWHDNRGLDKWIFSHNQSGSFANITSSTWGPNNESTQYLNLTLTRGQTLAWNFYAYDKAGNLNNSMPYQFLTILNTAPTQSKPLLTSTSGKNLNNDNLTCYPQNTNDADNDNVVNIFNWYLNSQPFAVLNMPFETSAKDYSGNNNNGAIYGTTFEASKTAGKVGNALSFDGINDYVEINDASSLDITKPITIETWIKPSGIQAGYSRILFKGDGDSPGVWSYALAYDPTGNYIRLLTYTTSAVTSISPTVNTANLWHHVVGTYDGSIQKLYINGVEVDSDSQSGNLRNSGKLGIGAEVEPSSERYFNGSIDEVHIYNKAMTPEQIQVHYNLGYNKIVAEETKGGDIFLCQVTPTDGFDDGLINNSDPLQVLWAVTFNVTDSYSGVDLNGVTIGCNYAGFGQAPYTTNMYGPYGFPPGSWTCNFSEGAHFTKTITFIADDDKVVPVPMSESGKLSIEEHTWLEWLYECWHDGDCWNLLANINSTVSQIWQRVTRTDKSVVIDEKIVENHLNITSDIVINYTINMPYKESYAIGDMLPLRLYFWFTDVNKTKCYNQDKRNDSNRAENPYCTPLIAETIGPNNGTVKFNVTLRPNLAEGDYNIIRRIEIDPDEVWINYGQENMGVIHVLESNSQAEIDLNEGSVISPSITGAAILSSITKISPIKIALIEIAIFGILIFYVLVKKKFR